MFFPNGDAQISTRRKPILRSLELRSLAFIMIGAFSGTAFAQVERMNEAAAKDAIHRIVQHSGLLPNFTVREDDKIRTAQAFIKGKQRVIAYNPAFISSILDSSGCDLTAVSILAHEIAHHLLGHTLDPEGIHPGDELACDRYSGFILFNMNATLQDALAAMELAGNVHGTRSHPPKHARKLAIEQGWRDAERLFSHVDPQPFTVDRQFQYVVHFVGDENTYYVDTDDQIVWFNNYADPIAFGKCKQVEKGEYNFELTWEKELFFVDGKLNIWRRTSSGMQMQVGQMKFFATP